MTIHKHFGDVHGDIVKNLLRGGHRLWHPILVDFLLLVFQRLESIVCKMIAVGIIPHRGQRFFT